MAAKMNTEYDILADQFSERLAILDGKTGGGSVSAVLPPLSAELQDATDLLRITTYRDPVLAEPDDSNDENDDDDDDDDEDYTPPVKKNSSPKRKRTGNNRKSKMMIFIEKLTDIFDQRKLSRRPGDVYAGGFLHSVAVDFDEAITSKQATSKQAAKEFSTRAILDKLQELVESKSACFENRQMELFSSISSNNDPRFQEFQVRTATMEYDELKASIIEADELILKHRAEITYLQNCRYLLEHRRNILEPDSEIHKQLYRIVGRIHDKRDEVFKMKNGMGDDC